MAKICFPCALSVFWVRSNYFVISLSPSQGGFPTCPFITLLCKIFEDFFFIIIHFFLLKEKDFIVNFSILLHRTAAPGETLFIEPSLSAFVIQCSDAAGFWIPEKFVCSLSISMSVSTYVCVSLFFMFKAISKPKTRLGFLCEASYRVRR